MKANEILNGLQSIVDDYSFLAIIWHALFYLLVAAILFRWQPSNRLMASLLCIPLLSVATLAWLTGNPFNGTIFLIGAILILVFGLRAPDGPVSNSQLPFMVAGIIMIAFGLVYPHFIGSGSILKYIYASPVGLIPCPTLSVLVGFALLFSSFESQPISITLIVLGLFYGLFGAFKLGVTIDLFLLFGTLTLLTKYLLSLRYN